MAAWIHVVVAPLAFLFLPGCPAGPTHPPVDARDCGDGAAFAPIPQDAPSGPQDAATDAPKDGASWAPECNAMCGRLGPAGLNCPDYAPTPRKHEPCESVCTRRLRAGDTNQHFPCLMVACSCAAARDCSR